MERKEATNALRHYLYGLMGPWNEWHDSFSDTSLKQDEKERIGREWTESEIQDVVKVKELCESGADLDFIDSRGTPCMTQVFYHKLRVEFFVSIVRDVNARDQVGLTALCLAVEQP